MNKNFLVEECKIIRKHTNVRDLAHCYKRYHDVWKSMYAHSYNLNPKALVSSVQPNASKVLQLL